MLDKGGEKGQDGLFRGGCWGSVEEKEEAYLGPITGAGPASADGS